MIATQDLRTATLQAAETVHHDRQAGLARLDEIFNQGSAPSPALNGRYRGALLTTSINPVMDALSRAFFGLWLPWKGKVFNAAAQTGNNIFDNSGLWLSKLVFRGYADYIADGPNQSRALTFHTYTGAGKDDPGLTLLKLDYNLGINPSFVVRDVLDELVQVGDGYYLGKAHLLWHGHWRCAAYFTLAA